MHKLLKKLKGYSQQKPESIIFDHYKHHKITYEDLYKKSVAFGMELRKIVPQDELLIISLPLGIDCIIAYLGCLSAGICFIPTYPPKNEYDVARLESILELTNASYILALDNKILSHVQKQYHPTFIELGEINKILKQDEIEDFLFYDWQDDDVCFLQFSSGSTHRQKGVQITHQAFLNSLEMMKNALELTEDDKGCSWLPPYHDMGLIGSIFLIIYSGSKVILMDPRLFAVAPIKWLSLISKEKCTITSAPNFAYDLCSHRIHSQTNMDHLDLSSLRAAINGSEFIRPQTIKNFEAAFENYGLKKNVLKPAYGLAETTLMATYSQTGSDIKNFSRRELHLGKACEKHSSSEETVSLVSVGFPLPDIKICIVDHQTKELRPLNHIGEIWIKSPSNAKGYYNDQEKTQECFFQRIENSLLDGFVRTGDTGFLTPTGELFITGRSQDIVKHHGKCISAEEIEDLVAQALHDLNIDPSYRNSALFLTKEANWEFVFIQEVKHNHPLEAMKQTISAVLHQSLSVQPDKVLFINRGCLPRTTSGKIKRHAARVLYQYDALTFL